MTLLGLGLRWAHLVASVALVGAAAILLLAGRSDRPTAIDWEARVLAWSRGLALGALLAGLAVLGWQTALVEGRPGAALEPASVARLLTRTQAGFVWILRHALLVALAAFLVVRLDTRRSLDWRAARGEALLLGGAALALLGAASHAAAVEPDALTAMAVHAVHLLGAGVWLGALPFLALLLGAASREAGADARPHAVRVARRFSRLALGAVLVLAATGIANAWMHVGTVAGLVGTSYGRLLLVKLALFAPVLALAGLNRRLLPRLAGPGTTVGRPAMRRLRQLVLLEAALGAALLVAVALMGLTPPARHEQPTWPFPVRLTTVALDDAPGLAWRVLVGGQVAVLGLVAALCGISLPRLRRPLVVGGAVGIAAAGLLALPPLAIDAYPTTYLRPAIPYQASSITAGLERYRQHCASCHGPSGAGDGPAGLGLPRPPADLRAPHTAHHTAGDLFWWLTRGIPAAGMPAFGGILSEEQRWDLINLVRAFSAGHAASALGPVVAPERPEIVAPDFVFAVGPTPPRTLRQYRGRRIVLLVVYTLPDSRPRLVSLAEKGATLALLGAEVIAVPSDARPDAIAQLGDTPRIFFPVVTEGAAAIVEAYRLFAPPPHAEFLIDRQGYLRAIFRSATEAGDANTVLAEIQTLNEEKTTPPAPEEHVH